MYGTTIAKATIQIMVMDVGGAVHTDDQGRWGVSGDVGSRWLLIDVSGYEPLAFDYSSGNKHGKKAKDEPVFLSPADAAVSSCKSPIYIRLAAAGSRDGVITLDAQKGLQTRKRTN